MQLIMAREANARFADGGGPPTEPAFIQDRMSGKPWNLPRPTIIATLRSTTPSLDL